MPWNAAKQVTQHRGEWRKLVSAMYLTEGPTGTEESCSFRKLMPSCKCPDVGTGEKLSSLSRHPRFFPLRYLLLLLIL